MPETVRVKIAVGVSQSGCYNAAGRTGMDDRNARATASEVWEDRGWARDVQVYWVYADIPLPQRQEIEASAVVPAQSEGG